MNANALLIELVEQIRVSKMGDELKVACLAQAILESGWAESRVSNLCLNFWGMKFRNEMIGFCTKLVVQVTSEPEGEAEFCKFASVEKAVAGWQHFLTRRPYKGWDQHQGSAEAFIRFIGPTWCPNPNYTAKVVALLPSARAMLDIMPGKAQQTFLLDPGHSEQEPGARSNNGKAEEEDLARLQVKIIQKQTAPAIKCDIYDPLVDAIDEIGRKAKGYGGFISCHLNSYEGNANPGAEVFVRVGANAVSKILARKILERICEKTGDTNRGVKEKNWTVIFEASKVCQGPVMLIESFFLNPYNRDEAEKRAIACAEAIAEVLNEEYN